MSLTLTQALDSWHGLSYDLRQKYDHKEERPIATDSALNARLFHPLLADQIDRLTTPHNLRDGSVFVRLTADFCEPLPILERIAASTLPCNFFFKSKDDALVLGGLDCALTLSAETPEDILNRLNDFWAIDPNVAFFGGFSFLDGHVSSFDWQPFNHYHFTLPFVEMRQTASGFALTLNYVNSRKLSRDAIISDITEKLRNLDACVGPVHGYAPYGHLPAFMIPDKSDWNLMVKKALRSISDGDIQKIVLARKKVITQPKAWEPTQLLLPLAKIDEHSFTFYYQIGRNVAFLGRSPERLLRVCNGRIQTEAIAGTRPRGHNDLDDERMEAALLGSLKETDEHRFVTGFIEATLRRFCSDVRLVSRQEILKLKNVQHIITSYEGRACGNLHPLTIARQFHPTPAVGGMPADGIPQRIRQSEPFERGWYAAPIGWMTKDNADFAVGIRSALINGNHLHIFAGAGIVRQSNAQSEWNETEKKMDNFTAIVGEP